MTILSAILFVSIILTSCSSKSVELKIKKNETIEGPLKGYIEIADQPYKLEFEKQGDYFQAYINVKIKILRPIDFDIPNSGAYNSDVIDLTLNFLDEFGTEPISEMFGLAGSEYDEFVNFLKSGSGEKIFKMRGPQSISSESHFIEKSDWGKVKFFNISSSIKKP
jgi:hypothetical protein